MALPTFLHAQAAGGSDPGAAPSLAGLDAWLAALPLPGILRRDAGMLIGADGAPRLSHLRLGVAAPALRALMGPQFGADPDLVTHARRSLARRLLQAMADPSRRRALLGETPPPLAGVPLHLDMPPDPVAAEGAAETSPASASPARAMLVAVVPVAAAARPDALARQRASLARHGWALALGGLSAGLLRLLDPAALESDLLRLRWSSALPASLPPLDPARLVLTGCEGQEALSWGRAQGIARFEGKAAAEALQASSCAGGAAP